MREEEINQILEPKKKSRKLFRMFFIYLGIGVVCIGSIFYFRFAGSMPVSERTLTVLKTIAMIGVFFLVIAFGFLLPGIIKTRKTLHNNDLVDELRRELAHETETPYKEYKLYLTRKYVISGIEAVKYEDIIWGYVKIQSSYGIKTGRDLFVYTKDKKLHTLVSVAPKNHLPDIILTKLQSKNPQMRVGYNEENKKFFNNYKKQV